MFFKKIQLKFVLTNIFLRKKKNKKPPSSTCTAPGLISVLRMPVQQPFDVGLHLRTLIIFIFSLNIFIFKWFYFIF